MPLVKPFDEMNGVDPANENGSEDVVVAGAANAAFAKLNDLATPPYPST